jgi:hypothetical protein
MADKTDPIVDAQHDETGRMWRGPLSQLPRRYAVLPVAELQALRAENARLRAALRLADRALAVTVMQTAEGRAVKEEAMAAVERVLANV